MTDYPPFPRVFFEEEEWLTVCEIRRHGFRLGRGVEYRVYSLVEIRAMIKDGSLLPVKPRTRLKTS